MFAAGPEVMLYVSTPLFPSVSCGSYLSSLWTPTAGSASRAATDAEFLLWITHVHLQVMSVVGILQDETDPMVSVMKVRGQGKGLFGSAVQVHWSGLVSGSRGLVEAGGSLPQPMAGL
jgi:hypothetical protein